MEPALVIAIHPRFADAILEGRKTFELRRRFPAVAPGTLIYLYATAPTSGIVGGFTSAGQKAGSPEAAWREKGKGLALSRK